MRKLATVSLSCAAGVVLCCYLLPGGLRVPLGVLAWALLPVALFLVRGNRGLRMALVCAGLGLGLLWTAAYEAIFFQSARELDDTTIRLTATVLDYPVEREYGYQLSVRLEGERPIKAVLYADQQGADLGPGDIITTVAHMTLGSRSAAGEDITFYTAKGIFLWGQCYGLMTVERPPGLHPSHWPAQLAHLLKESIRRAFPADAAPVVEAVVTGSRDKLTDQFTTSLERTGLSHTVAVSGMHLSCFAGMLTLLLGRGKVGGAMLVILWSVLFTAVAGATPSVSRAAVMIVLLQLAPILRRERDSLTALSLALMLLLLWNPYSAAHVGLQLSFGAVAGILFLAEPLQRKCYEVFRLAIHSEDTKLAMVWKRLGQGMCAVVCTTLGAMAATVPLTAIYFQKVSLIAPLTNLLTLWAVTGVFAGGLVTGLAGLACPPLAALLVWPVSLLAGYVEGCTQLFAALPLASVTLDSFYYRAWLVLCYVLLLLALAERRRKGYIVPLCCCLSMLCLSVMFTALDYRTGAMTVTALDVGQGQSILLRFDGAQALVDCGGDSYDDPGDLAADYIQSRGYGGLELLILTHCHQDHAGGVPQLLRRLKVEVLLLPEEEDTPLREEILSIARERGVEVRIVESDTDITFRDGETLHLYPPLARGEDKNESGLAVQATSGAFHALITGDMGGLTERMLLRHADLPEMDLLVAGHHGAQTSTTDQLLAVIRPKVCIISVGVRNRYGHPHPDTLERLAGMGTAVYRTDQQGNIGIRVNGPTT